MTEDCKGRKVTREISDPRVNKIMLDYRDQEEILMYKAPKAILETLDYREILVHKDL